MITAARARYIADLKNGKLLIYDLSKPCLSPPLTEPLKSDWEAHKQVINIFNSFGLY